VAGSIVVVVAVMPVTVRLDFHEPLTAPPAAATILLGGSSTLLGIAACVLRRRHAVQGISATPLV